MPELNPAQFLHSSDVLFEPGDVIHPASKIGRGSAWSHLETYSPEHVYMYRQHEVPPSFRKQGGAVYEVEPLGPTEPDPEGTPGAYRTSSARVSRIVENGWRDPAERIPAALRGPNWKPTQQTRARRVPNA